MPPDMDLGDYMTIFPVIHRFIEIRISVNPPRFSAGSSMSLDVRSATSLYATVKNVATVRIEPSVVY